MEFSETNEPRRPAFLAVDVGGTNTKFAVVGDCGHVLARDVISTGLISSPQDACKCMLDIAEECSMQYRLQVELLRDIQPHQVYAAGDLSDPHGTHRTCL